MSLLPLWALSGSLARILTTLFSIFYSSIYDSHSFSLTIQTKGIQKPSNELLSLPFLPSFLINIYFTSFVVLDLGNSKDK